MIVVTLSPPAADAAFYTVFGVFVVAFVVLSVITLKWALRQDRAGRREWVQRRVAEQASPEEQVPPPATNGRPPSKGAGPRKPPS